MKGNFTQCSASNPLCVPAKDRKPIFSKVFEKGKRYLLRLINSSTESGFIFTIDNHLLEIVTTDLVPIHSFKNESLHIGIGKPLYMPAIEQYLIVTRSKILCDRRSEPICTSPSGWQLLDPHYSLGRLQ